MTWPVRVLTSVGCFVARKLAEPVLKGKANEATWVSYAPFTKMGFGRQRVSQRWLVKLNHRVFLMQRGPLKGLSCVMGNYHAQFLGGKGVERPLLYPELFSTKPDILYIEKRQIWNSVYLEDLYKWMIDTILIPFWFNTRYTSLFLCNTLPWCDYEECY